MAYTATNEELHLDEEGAGEPMLAHPRAQRRQLPWTGGAIALMLGLLCFGAVLLRRSAMQGKESHGVVAGSASQLQAVPVTLPYSGGVQQAAVAAPAMAAPFTPVEQATPVTPVAQARPITPANQCPGSTMIQGLGERKLVNSKITKEGTPCAAVDVQPGGWIAPHLGGRTYFAKTCTDGSYDNNAYEAVQLLGKTVQYTVDLGGTGCGCNVAVYFTSMQKNPQPTACQDHYCDANSVCGVRCDEVDVMEANSLVWRSTLHLADDNVGGAAGYGGTGPHTQTWTKNEYGPGSTCINTNLPFDVKAHFPATEDEELQGMMIDLIQGDCNLTATVGWYKFKGKDAIKQLTTSLKEGMVPIVSYWSSAGLLWLDGKDINGEVPCAVDRPNMCPETGPKVSNFQVRNFTGWLHHSTMNLSPTPAPKPKPKPAAQATAVPAATAVAQPAAAPAAVPDTGNWIKVQNGAQTYYYNKVTKVSAWELPTR
mmetsp:Transcript_23990/g.59823  ORF Transcript_23990/g.59823 Transcript_23990/m.59823 type:complete len:482 (+) Transcript_23990:91-1536(+)|eukprot:CAMPEP_0115250952 /NCGR_PEP_ID=MMETSP0270-20121206/43377_1 /TAXON_ID=71861 /ORGANISM="Scrippsiella trochoidea, Strain CCMP3099" /LENGTH=481 /DNA_ID=CAMNT_0002666353 /DNA_START=96 /DNA_END=1541 /DNA_ORIENTATION=+